MYSKVIEHNLQSGTHDCDNGPHTNPYQYLLGCSSLCFCIWITNQSTSSTIYVWYMFRINGPHNTNPLPDASAVLFEFVFRIWITTTPFRLSTIYLVHMSVITVHILTPTRCISCGCSCLCFRNCMYPIDCNTVN
jgi:hypothetical protein